MGKKAIQLLVVEDNREMCDVLKSYFSITPEVDLCAIAYNGEEALQLIEQYQPDVVLLDMIMPKIDGLSVLKELKQSGKAKKTRIIVASAIAQENITCKALALGADYYMIKPYNLTDLLERICLVATGAISGIPQGLAGSWEQNPKQNNVELLIAKLLMSIHLPTNVLGYKYTVTAVNYLVQQNRPCALTKEIYSEVAEVYQTRPVCVEGAIRKSIHSIFSLENQEFCDLLRAAGASCEKAPSNGQFLNVVSERIKQDL